MQVFESFWELMAGLLVVDGGRTRAGGIKRFFHGDVVVERMLETCRDGYMTIR